MTRDEVDAFTDIVAADPPARDSMEETVGCRKVRFARRGAGRSGSYRVITYFGGASVSVFLLTVFGKGGKFDLNKAERIGLAFLTKTLAEAYRQKVVNMGSAR